MKKIRIKSPTNGSNHVSDTVEVLDFTARSKGLSRTMYGDIHVTSKGTLIHV